MSTVVSTTLEDRVILVLREAGEVYGMWQRLEELTGVTAARWRKAYASLQRPTPDMVQAICRLRPQYAFWVATGITDAEHGHKAPASALPFPEWRGIRASDQAAVDYFMTSLGLLDVLAMEGLTNGEDQAYRLEDFGLRRIKDHWSASPLAKVASEIAGRSSAYRELKRLRELRAVPAKAAAKARPADPGTERVDPLTHHMMGSDLYWSPQPSDAS